MGSRYALRELEGAIGYDCRRLDDGRRAVFRHTAIHKAAKRDFLERRDMMSIMSTRLMSWAGICSNSRISPRDAFNLISDEETRLMELVFPYIEIKKRHATDEEDMDRYFDELDEIVKAKNGSPKPPEDPDAVGVEVRK